ncbi:hypothetical protein [Paenibacillus sp. DMB5]|uniref:hypothetical protein n=1 Tax=Paenibacillus sp. DMB5 TaxID=1780103 RepID=UPI00076BEA5E|nr:hypothetical protein [Paenibacillus sp. DMB5]KUP25941.1 hypothetical protein AWJ19_33535 [Paenibacillus sp. DMB5]
MQTNNISLTSSTPPSVQLLFDNLKLDITKVLVLLRVCSLKSKLKYNKISEIVFYYSLVNFELTKFYEPKIDDNVIISTNQYFRFQVAIYQIILEMSQVSWIEVKGDISFKPDEIGVRITSTGIEFVESLTSEYFATLSNNYVRAMELIKFNSENVKKLKGEAK